MLTDLRSNSSAGCTWSFGMRNGERSRAGLEVVDKVVFRSWKSMKPDGLPDRGGAFCVFPPETRVPRWKLLARAVAEAYDGRNASPWFVE
jgi:hypothetical protein